MPTLTPSYTPIVAALDTAMTLSPNDPTWHEAMVTLLSRRGTRDALIARGAKADAFPYLGMSALLLQTDDPTVIANAACLVAIGQWYMGDASAHDTVAPFLSDHRMAHLIAMLLERGIPAHEWLNRMAEVDEATCLAFTG